MRVWNSEGKQTMYMISPAPGEAGEWYHLAFTCRDGEVRIFVNGHEGSYTSDGVGDAMMVMPTGDAKVFQVGSDCPGHSPPPSPRLKTSERVIDCKAGVIRKTWNPFRQ